MVWKAETVTCNALGGPRPKCGARRIGTGRRLSWLAQIIFANKPLVAPTSQPLVDEMLSQCILNHSVAETRREMVELASHCAESKFNKANLGKEFKLPHTNALVTTILAL